MPPTQPSKRYRGLDKLGEEDLQLARNLGDGPGVPPTNPFQDQSKHHLPPPTHFASQTNITLPQPPPPSFDEVEIYQPKHASQTVIHDDYYSDTSQHHPGSSYYDCGTDKEIDLVPEYVEPIHTPKIDHDEVLEYDVQSSEYEHFEEPRHLQQNAPSFDDAVTIENTIKNTPSSESSIDNTWIYAGIAIVAVFLFIAISRRSRS